MERRKAGWPVTAAVTLLAAGLMIGLFAAGENGYRPQQHLSASQTVTGLGHPRQEGQININTATARELTALPGIGPVRAEAIVAWREENGPFVYPEDLLRVSGIGEGTLEKLLAQITTGGE